MLERLFRRTEAAPRVRVNAVTPVPPLQRQVLDFPQERAPLPPVPKPTLAPLPPAGAMPATHLSAPVFESFTALPEFVRILSQGENAIHKVARQVQPHLVALDFGAMRCALLRSAGAEGELRASIEHEYQTLRSQLKVHRYTLMPDLVATADVMQEVQRQSSQQGRRSKSKAIELFWRWVEIGVREEATDLHVEIHGMKALVRARIGGELEPLPDGQQQAGQYPARDALDAVAAAYNDTRTGNNNPNYDAGRFIDCMVPFDVSGASGYLRYQNLKGRLGPKVVVRILRNHADTQLSLGSAGYAQSQLRQWRVAGRSGKGVILIAGRVGSGKSTSMACFLKEFPQAERRALYTVEDPIEYEMNFLHQIEVLRDLSDEKETKRRYAEVMRSLLRGDLDGVAIGEIRDPLTANFAITVGESGHLALGTVHAHGIPNMIPRLTNPEVGLTREALTNPQIINTLVYQALVPLLCPKCSRGTQEAVLRRAEDPEPAEYAALLERKFRLPTERLRWRHPAGCAHCHGRGTKGKTIVAEMWQPDRRWLDLVRRQEDYQALTHYRSFSDRDFLSPDMTGKTVFEHALFKALCGQIDVRCVNEFEPLERFEILES